MKTNIVAFVLLGLVLSASGQSSRYGGRRHGDVPAWCPVGSPRIYCFANPCTVERCPAFPRARCINDNPCERNCIGNFYWYGRRLSRRQCRRGGSGHY